ncbi:MFS transporter [Streptacidiphilus anmyonensis]|uniref:MFS transporter n=1 Tax=Streptacidiphilus anmyonensis TaxID=405782 RepID=UPI0005A8C724|nr:MFS transporter [Streptacidiphilus anmyonensis]
MATSTSPKHVCSPRPGLGDRLGLPDLRGSGRFVAANLIDSLGNGMMMSFVVVYFARTTRLSLLEVGAALSLGQLLAMAAPALIGPLVDRYGARRVVVAGNLVSAAGFGSYLVARAPWQIVLATLVVQAGANAYWTSSSALVVLAAKDGERPRWFAFLRALRNIGAGTGGVGAALAVSIASSAGLRAVVAGNAVTFLLAAFLIGTWRPRRKPTEGSAASRADAPKTDLGYLTVLRDRSYLRLVLVNLVFVLTAMMPTVLLAVYVTGYLRSAAWLVGVLVVINSALVAALQTVSTRWTARCRPSTLLVLGTLLNAVAFVAFALLVGLPGWAVVAGAVLAMIVFTAAEILRTSPIGELSVAMASEQALGRYLAVFQFSWTIGGAAAPLLFTSLLSYGPCWPWIFLALISVLVVPMASGLDRNPQGRA